MEIYQIQVLYIVITTLSPCNKHMDERYGDSCSHLLNHTGITKVYCGYIDPTQYQGAKDRRLYNLMETQNHSIRDLCERFAATFLDKI